MSASLSSSESGPKFRVAIWCVATLMFGHVIQVPFQRRWHRFAITIGKHDPSIPIDLYEAHDSVDSAGVGISVWKRTYEILIDLGLFDDFKQIFTHVPDSSGPCVRRSDIREGRYIWRHNVYRVNKDGPSSMHRQHMVGILERHLPSSCTVHPKKRLVSYIETRTTRCTLAPPVTLNFADGTTATTDVLIGADEVRSAVRKALFEAASDDKNGDDEIDLEQYIDATFTGITVYRWLIPVETLKKENPEHPALKDMMFGKYVSCHIYSDSPTSRLRSTVFPIRLPTALINVVVFVTDPSSAGTHYEGHWVSDGSHDELVECFRDFEPAARTLVELCDKPSKWALHAVKPLPFCVRKKVALIGDACHAMTPHFGAGAGQAIDDAFVLGRLIAHLLTTLSPVPEALRIYDEIRLPFARSVASLSLSTGWLYMFLEPG
ncbi:hypothetical protein J3R82DRAFT_8148 [Butyriboletus roseoflavus]|nr:hypothetical protein J3R82DRAFT_8148 [Butyriboletus roseoflavus]